jgi:hypothetical protein
MCSNVFVKHKKFDIRPPWTLLITRIRSLIQDELSQVYREQKEMSMIPF